jgi:hypothetical protein
MQVGWVGTDRGMGYHLQGQYLPIFDSLLHFINACPNQAQLNFKIKIKKILEL